MDVKQISAIVGLDFDATLVDSFPALWDAWCKIVPRFSRIPMYSLEDFRAICALKHWTEVMVDLGVHDRDGFERAYVEVIQDCYQEHTIWFDGVLDTICKLETKGIRFFVATDNYGVCIAPMLTSAGFGHFPFFAASDLGRDWQKPSKKMLVKALEEMGWTPESEIPVFYVGDALHDFGAVEAAREHYAELFPDREFSMSAIWARNGSLLEPSAAKAHPHIEMNDFRELPKIVLSR